MPASDLGTYRQSFTVSIPGLVVTSPCVVPMGSQGMKATLSSEAGRLQIALEIPNIDHASAPQSALRVAASLLDAVVLECAEHVQQVCEMNASGSSFRPNIEPGSTVIRIATADTITVLGGGGVPGYTAACSLLSAVGHSVGMKLEAPQVPTSADLNAAKEMFQVGMKSADKVVRFLVLYSVLGLIVMFDDARKRPTQDNVDDLLKTVNSSLQEFPKPRPSGRKPNESEYTKLRNEFIHAEDRKKDPAIARTTIETDIYKFQRDVAAVLKAR